MLIAVDANKVICCEAASNDNQEMQGHQTRILAANQDEDYVVEIN